MCTRYDYYDVSRTAFNWSNRHYRCPYLLIIEVLDVKYVYFDASNWFNNWNQHRSTYGLPMVMNPYCSDILLSYYSPLIQTNFLNCNEEWAHFNSTVIKQLWAFPTSNLHRPRTFHTEILTFNLQSQWNTTKVNGCMARKGTIQLYNCATPSFSFLSQTSALSGKESHWYLLQASCIKLSVQYFVLFSVCLDNYRPHTLFTHSKSCQPQKLYVFQTMIFNVECLLLDKNRAVETV